jgi:hypothetical protein
MLAFPIVDLTAPTITAQFEYQSPFARLVLDLTRYLRSFFTISGYSLKYLGQYLNPTLELLSYRLRILTRPLSTRVSTNGGQVSKLRVCLARSYSASFARFYTCNTVVS